MQQHLLATAQIYRAYMSIVLTLECGGEEKKKKKHTLAIQYNPIQSLISNCKQRIRFMHDRKY